MLIADRDGNCWCSNTTESAYALTRIALATAIATALLKLMLTPNTCADACLVSCCPQVSGCITARDAKVCVFACVHVLCVNVQRCLRNICQCKRCEVSVKRRPVAAGCWSLPAPGNCIHAYACCNAHRNVIVDLCHIYCRPVIFSNGL